MAASDQPLQQRVDLAAVKIPVSRVQCSLFLPADVGDQLAIGTETCGETRYHEVAYAEKLGHLADVASGGAAAADHIALPRINAFLHRNVLDGRNHVVIAHGVDGICRIVQRQAELGGDFGHGRLSLAAVEFYLCSKIIIGIDDAEHDIGIGDGGLGSAQAIAGRTGPCPGTLRTHAQ